MKKQLSLIFVLLLIFVSCGKTSKVAGTSSDQISKWPDLTNAIDSLYADLKPYQTGGISAVIHKGEVLHLKGYGASNREFDVPWTPDTVYLLASVTKSITASALLELVDQGLIAFDDPLAEYLPDYPEFDTPLTIRHLLSMTSGLWQDEVLLPLAGVTGAVSLDTLYSLSKSQGELEYPPGSNYRYTDTNFRLLARIITLLTGSEDFTAALKQLLFDSLGMDSSSAPPDLWFVQDNQALTYLTMPGSGPPPMTIDIHVPVSGDGGVRTTMNDFIRWLLYMREGVEKGESRWQRLNQVVHLADGTESHYRLGVYLFEHRGLEGIAHGGFTGTGYIFFPEIDLIVAFFHNDLGTFDRTTVARTVIDAFLMSEKFDRSQLEQNKDWSKIYGTRPDVKAYTGVNSFLGSYVETKDGLILVLSESSPGQLRVSYKGSARHFLESKDGRLFKTVLSVGPPVLEILLIDAGNGEPPAVQVREAHWDIARSFKRVIPEDTYTKPAAELEGFYYSKALDVFYSVRFEDNRYVMRIGSGAGPTQKFSLIKLTDDIYEANALDAGFYDMALGLGRFGVKFYVGDGHRVTGLRIITDRLRQLDFQKVVASL